MKTTLLSSIRASYNSFCGIDAANKKAVERAHETAKALYADIAPEDGAALRDALSEIKAAAASVIKPKNGTQWKNLWSHVSDFCYCWLVPETPVTLGEGQAPVTAGGIVNDERPLIANVRKAATAARKAAGVGGTAGNGRAPRTPEAKATPADDAAAASDKAFEADAASALALVKRILAMPSGLGLLSDALKAHGYGVVKLSAPSKQYDIPPPKELPEPAQPPKGKRPTKKAQATS